MANATDSMERVTRVFNGTYTIQNRATSDYRTFRIRTQKDDAKFAPGQRIISLRTGPGNSWQDWRQFGFVTEDGIKVWRSKSNLIPLAKAFWAIVAEERFGEQYEVLVSATCFRCNRELTVPASIKSGIGPVCADRMTEVVNGQTMTVAEADRIRSIARQYKKLQAEIARVKAEE